MSKHLDDYVIAYQRAISKLGVKKWAAMVPETQTAAIFQELRLMRSERDTDQELMNGKVLGGT